MQIKFGLKGVSCTLPLILTSVLPLKK